MKLLLTTTALFVCHASAQYAAGQPCYTNQECDRYCPDKTWTIGLKDDGGSVLECNTPEADPLLFYKANCQQKNVILANFPPIINDSPGTTKACQTLGGRKCVGCVVSGKRSDDAATREKWKSTYSSGLAQLQAFVYKADAENSADC